MAHFAKVQDGIVTDVIAVSNAALKSDGDFPASETSGQEFLASIGLDGVWLQTSYNRNFRGNYAGIGYTYDADLDAFIPPQPYPSWVLDEATYSWIPPVPMPEDGVWMWDEQSGEWVSE